MPLLLLRRQPFKGLFLAYQLLSTLFVRIPLWTLLNLKRSPSLPHLQSSRRLILLRTVTSSWRPRKSWSLVRTLRVNLIRHLTSVVSRSGPIGGKLPDHLSISAGPDIHGTWVEPVPNLIGGQLRTFANKASVVPVRIPGYWLCKPGSSFDVTCPPQPGEKVIMALHGGAYVRLSAHPNDVTAVIARGLLEHVSSVRRVFSLEYRLSRGPPSAPAHSFPAALLDALAGYNYLVNTVGFSPSSIYIEGDSAGGNLALALTRYLVQSQNDPSLGILNIPAPPTGIILLSPWSDIGTSHDKIPGGSATTCTASDILHDPNTGAFDYVRRAFLGPHGLDAAQYNEYISPASLDPRLDINFKDFPRTFIVAGGAEIILDQIRTLNAKMATDLGEGDGLPREGKVRYFEASDAIHDYLVFPWHEPERSDTLNEIQRWISVT